MSFIYIDYKNNRAILWQRNFPIGTLLTEVDAVFTKETGLDPVKAPHVGVYWMDES